jgi:hypothetical protein
LLHIIGDNVNATKPETRTAPANANANSMKSRPVRPVANASGAYTSGSVIFDINYNYGRQTTVTGFHIHDGVAGINGPVIINTGLSPTAPLITAANGIGNFRKVVEVNMANPTQVGTLYGLLTRPKDFYINMHTIEAGGGLIRDQLRNTDVMTFDVTMLPSNLAS